MARQLASSQYYSRYSSMKPAPDYGPLTYTVMKGAGSDWVDYLLISILVATFLGILFGAVQQCQ